MKSARRFNEDKDDAKSYDGTGTNRDEQHQRSAPKPLYDFEQPTIAQQD